MRLRRRWARPNTWPRSLIARKKSTAISEPHSRLPTSRTVPSRHTTTWTQSAPSRVTPASTHPTIRPRSLMSNASPFIPALLPSPSIAHRDCSDSLAKNALSTPATTSAATAATATTTQGRIRTSTADPSATRGTAHPGRRLSRLPATTEGSAAAERPEDGVALAVLRCGPADDLTMVVGRPLRHWTSPPGASLGRSLCSRPI